MTFSPNQHIAVIGAGIAGSACAHALALAGHSVHMFDKARGPGGRLATRRVEWVDRHGQACTTRFDHGAVGITSRSPEFRIFIDQALTSGWLAEWTPTLAAGSVDSQAEGRRCVPIPDLPSLCRRLLDGVTKTWSFAVDGLHKGAAGWQVQAGAERHVAHFDAVLLAMPPGQAASLLGAHRPDWARHASVAPMQPCWTLMGVTIASKDGPRCALEWDAALPPAGPLSWVLRSDARPGRERVAGQAHWVAHARAGWSRQHLEQPAAWVQQQLQTALAECLGRHVEWQHCMVHRWRYAMPQAPRATTPATSWWDAAQGLGVCGDFLGGGNVGGVEGAWLSGRSLAAALLQRASDTSIPIPIHGAVGRIAA